MQPLPGLYLPAPHPEAIINGIESRILLANYFRGILDQPIYLCDHQYIYAKIKVTTSEQIDLKQMEKTTDLHGVQEKEVEDRWGATSKLYLYNFGLIEAYEPPLKYKGWNKTIKTLIADATPLNNQDTFHTELQKIQNISDYDPSKQTNSQLSDDIRIVTSWISKKIEWGEI